MHTAEHAGSLSLQSDSGALVAVRMKPQLPYPEHACGQVLDAITQILATLSQLSQGLQLWELVQGALDRVDEALLDTLSSSAVEGMQAALLSPSSPTKPPPLKQGPQVCELVMQGERLILKHSGAREQFTEFNTELMVEIACFILSALPAASFSCPATRPCSADWFTCMRDTVTEVMADALEFKES